MHIRQQAAFLNKALFACLAGMFAVSGQAQEELATVPKPAIVRFAQLATSACLPIASGASGLGISPEQDLQLVPALGFDYGIDADIYKRFGPENSGVLNRAIMGNNKVGDDLIVLAVGGRIPGCKLILLGSDTDDLMDAVADALVNSTTPWKEMPLAIIQAGAQTLKRNFILRDVDRSAYLLRLFTATSSPGSDVRLMIIIDKIPSHVQLPDGL